MKEKITAFFTNEKVQNFGKKVFNKKVFKTTIAVIILFTVLRIGFSLLFEVNGIVRKVDGKNITVANFLTTQTVNIGDYPISNTNLTPGERIKITKDLKGQVLTIRTEGSKMERGRRDLKEGKNFKANNKFDKNSKDKSRSMNRSEKGNQNE